MTVDPAFKLPADAGAKAEEKAKTVDHYADLTDEERAEEGLPPREPAKPESEPGKEAPLAPAKTPEAEPEPTPEDDAAIEALFEEVASLREDIGAALGKPEPAPETKEDALIKAAMEHDDPVVRGLAERLQQAEARLTETQNVARQERVERQLTRDDADFDAVQQSYLVAGQPMTDAQVEQVEDYILRNPEVGRRLSIEQVARVVFPDAVKRSATSPPAKGGPGDASTRNSPAVATIVDAGSTVGGGAPEKWKPRPNETIESAITEAGKRLFKVTR